MSSQRPARTSGPVARGGSQQLGLSRRPAQNQGGQQEGPSNTGAGSTRSRAEFEDLDEELLDPEQAGCWGDATDIQKFKGNQTGPSKGLSKAEQAALTKRVNTILNQQFPKIGYYPDVGECETIVAQLLGFHDPTQAYSHEQFLTYSSKVAESVRGLRSASTTKIADYTRVYYGPDHTSKDKCPFPLGLAKGQVNSEAAKLYLGDGLQDSFGNTSFRKVLAATFPGGPLPEAVEAGGDAGKITHLTAHQLALVDVKVVSMLSGEVKLAENLERDEVLLTYKNVAINFQNKDTSIVKTKAVDSA